MSDPRVEAAKAQIAKDEHYASGMTQEEYADWLAPRVVAAVDAVSSQYEQVGWWCELHDLVLNEQKCIKHGTHVPVFRRIERAETRALIDNRTPTETAEAKAWSDDAHARIRAGEVSGSHDLMREKVGEYRADTQEAE